jgi:hypothetical protein
MIRFPDVSNTADDQEVAGGGEPPMPYGFHRAWPICYMSDMKRKVPRASSTPTGDRAHTGLCRTRVPLVNLVDYLEGGESIEDFLDAFPTVKREQAIAVIEAGKLAVLETISKDAHPHR